MTEEGVMSGRYRSTVETAEPVQVFVVQDRSPEELQALATLENDRMRLMHQLAQLEREENGEGMGGDPGDRGAQAAGVSKRAAMRRIWVKMLAEVERALARLESGDYGRCEMCSGPIPAERL